MRADADRHDSTRRTFLGLMPLSVAAGVATVSAWPRSIVRAEDVDGDAGKALPAHFPQQDQALVHKVVGASHARIDVVRELVEAQPALAKASYDWGFGDWESALGAASHTGRREIAELLMHHGARPNIFTHAMLGNLDIVKATMAAHPEIVRVPGPHSITLYEHALAGRDGAASVRTFLESLPDVPRAASAQPLDPEQHAMYEGTYTFGPGKNDTLVVATHRRGMLQLRKGAEGTPRTLHFLGNHRFYPAGAEAVRITFQVVADIAKTITVHDPDPVVIAQRLD